jgi:hypothetical protein
LGVSGPKKLAAAAGQQVLITEVVAPLFHRRKFPPHDQ